MNSPTGQQYEIRRGTSRAVITEVAAALREFSIGGIDIAEPYPVDSAPPSAAGIVLMPWPNRVADGTWTLDGAPQQLDITEVARGNALHGLLRYTGYRLIEQTESSVELGAMVFPQHGYPFLLDTSVRYELVDGGIRISHRVTNLSTAKAPVATGAHPFLTIGDVPSDELVLTVHADTYFDVDDRLNPIAERPVEGTRFDLRDGRVVGELELDTAYGALRTVDGVAATLRAPDGRTVSLVHDDTHAYVQVYTTPVFPKKGGREFAVAVEPMTAPPDAFNSGLGVAWVEPGDTWTASWGIQYSE